MKNRKIVVGTRGSKLALVQTGYVVKALREAAPGMDISIREIKTAGDRRRDISLERVGVAVFVKELEEALRQGKIDLAVHSLKDMPSEIPEGLCLAAVTERFDPRDVLVSPRGGLDGLPSGATIGTGSLRRVVQLAGVRPDLQVLTIRGNIDTRLRKVARGDYDGVILAAAAMIRLGLHEEITEYLPLEPFLPAAGQGALAVESRLADGDIIEMVSALDHPPSRLAVTAERAFLNEMGGGCHAPVAALGTVTNGLLKLEGMVAGPISRRVLRSSEEGDAASPAEIGLGLAGKMRSIGAAELIDEAGAGLAATIEEYFTEEN